MLQHRNPQPSFPGPLPLASLIPSARIRLQSHLDSRLIADHVQPAHSWVRNFHNWLYCVAAGFIPSGSTFGAGYLSLKDTGGTVRNLLAASYSYVVAGPVNDSNYGIVTGRGASAESYESYALATPITHGNGANQLSHRAGSAIAPGYTAGTLTWLSSFSRLFDNYSGSTITVTETGIVCRANNTINYYLLCRDLLASSIDVLNSGTLTVTYEISLTFPG